jgi:hypothetical protein
MIVSAGCQTIVDPEVRRCQVRRLTQEDGREFEAGRHRYWMEYGDKWVVILAALGGGFLVLMGAIYAGIQLYHGHPL